MSEASYRFCEVALPVPIHQLFTYEIPAAMRHRLQRGCRVLVPFGSRSLTGVVLALENESAVAEVREVRALVDDLLQLGHWIAEYYCAPIGEVLRGMLPLGGELRRKKTYTLTDKGRDISKQLFVADTPDAPSEVLRLLSERPRSAEYLAAKVKDGRRLLPRLVKRGWINVEEQHEEKDPARAAPEKLSAEFVQRPLEGVKLRKPERELLAFLELHPGAHNVAELSETLKNAARSARVLSEQQLVRLDL